MHILWIGKAPTDGDAGDEVFDRKVIAALRSHAHSVTTLHPARVSRWRELSNLARGIPHYRARFASPANRALIHAAQDRYDLTICSWEPLDGLAIHAPQPRVLIAHNISSLALPSMFPGSRLAALAARGARAWEARTYRRTNFRAIATLSRNDYAYVAGLPDPPETILTVPGMPPALPLDEDAAFRREIVVQGTFDWRPKQRDALLFRQDYGSVADPPPLLGLLPGGGTHPAPSDAACRSALRIGVITDRFVAGHKLKTLAYIARNQVVASYADVNADFSHIPDNEFFIRRVSSMRDVVELADTLSAYGAKDLRNRFVAFQAACAEAFTWSDVADRLVEAGSAEATH